MSILCSDKTGTITTAKLTISLDKIVCSPEAIAGLEASGFHLHDGGAPLNVADQEQMHDVMISLACLGSNPAKINDAVDSSVMRAFKTANERSGGRLQAVVDDFERVEISGFDPG